MATCEGASSTAPMRKVWQEAKYFAGPPCSTLGDRAGPVHTKPKQLRSSSKPSSVDIEKVRTLSLLAEMVPPCVSSLSARQQLSMPV